MRPPLILTEGACTEPIYLRAWLAAMGLLGEVRAGHRPHFLSLINEAIEERKQAPQRTCWVVADTEDLRHPKQRLLFRRACEKATAWGIQLALSNPCFEYWLLLHEPRPPLTHRLTASELNRRAKARWGANYKSQLPTPKLLPHWQRATERAAATAPHSDWHNPASSVGVMLEQLLQQAPAHSTSPGKSLDQVRV